jgi:hypothetical protein
MTTSSPAEPNLEFLIISTTASFASSLEFGKTTPFPAAKPEA